MTHKELVYEAARWLKREHRCPLVLQETGALSGEIPDVIGFFDGGDTVVIECKISRTDLKTDKKKGHRYYPEDGMGDYRILATTYDIWCGGGALLENWGLLIFDDGSFSVEREAERFEMSNKRGEASLLVTVIRLMGIEISPTFERPVRKKTRPSFFGGFRVYPKRNSDITRREEQEAAFAELVAKYDYLNYKEDEKVEDGYLPERKYNSKEDLEWREALADNYNKDYPYDDGEPRSVSVM